MDPYSTGSSGTATLLANAAAAGCVSANPFCLGPSSQAISGIYLQVKWCSFELYAGTLPSYLNNAGQPVPDPNYCNYVVTISQGDDFAENDAKTPCPTSYKYDVCPGQGPNTGTGSVLFDTLENITILNQLRESNGLPDLQIEIGLQAGATSALNALADHSIGYSSIPVSASANNLQGGGALSGYVCAGLPNFWRQSFVTRYENAIDKLIITVSGYIGGNGNSLAGALVAVKATPANTISEEFDTGGENSFHATGTDQNGSASFSVSCPPGGANRISGAQVWLNSLAANPGPINDCSSAFPSPTLIQAMECSFGDVAGNILGTLKTQGISSAVLSIPNNNGAAFPFVDCGIDEQGSTATGGGPGVCLVQPSVNTNPYYQDQWSDYYLYRAIYDLFNANAASYVSPAYVAASAAFVAADPGHAYAPLEERVATDFTALTGGVPTPMPGMSSSSQSLLTCGLNDSQHAEGGQYGIAFTLYAAPYSPPLLATTGTLISWQTSTTLFTSPTGGLTNACAAGADTLGPALANGTANGGQYIEIQPELGFEPDCSVDLSTNLANIQAQSLPARCVYP